MPRMKNSVILLLALASGMIAFLMSFRLMNQPGAVSTEKLIVAAVRDINIGSVIRRDDIDLLPAPEGTLMKSHYTTLDDVVGRVPRRILLKGQAIKNVDILAEGDNLASLIPQGYRAMTIPVTLSSNLSNLLQIGNRVDVLLTYEVSRGEINSITLIENARVIGVSDMPGNQGGRELKVHVTLAVTPDGAQTLAYAMEKGTLNISIRSLGEQEDEKFFTLKELFFPNKPDPQAALLPVEEKPPSDEIEIIRGLRREKFFHEQ